MFQLHEITVDELPLQYRSVGEPSNPSILFIADLTLDSAPAISRSRQLAKSYHLVLLPLPAAGLERLTLEGSLADADALLPELVAKFSQAIGLTQFALYAVGSLAPTAWWMAQRHRTRLLAVITQHDYGNGVDVTAPWYDLPPGMTEVSVCMDSSARSKGPCTFAAANSLRSKRDVAAVPTLVIIGDQGVALPLGADSTDLPAGHLISVRRLDTTYFSLDSFHCEIAAEVDTFLRGVKTHERCEAHATGELADALASATA